MRGEKGQDGLIMTEDDQITNVVLVVQNSWKQQIMFKIRLNDINTHALCS